MEVDVYSFWASERSKHSRITSIKWSVLENLTAKQSLPQFVLKNCLGASGPNSILQSSSSIVYWQVHLREVYRGRSTLDNNTPISVKKPPPWANLDRRVLSPIPDKEHREALWDDNFIHASSRMNKAQVMRTSFPDSRSNTTEKRRPASAGVQRSKGVDLPYGDEVRRANRPSSANICGRNIYSDKRGGSVKDKLRRIYEGATKTRWGDSSSQTCGRRWQGYGTREDIQARASHVRSDVLKLSRQRNIAEGTYMLDETQETTFRAFVAMLVDFDTFSAIRILDDAFLEAHLASGLQDFSGCGDG